MNNDNNVMCGRYLSFAAMTVRLQTVDEAIQRVVSRIAPDRFRRSTGFLNLSKIYEIDPPRGGAHLFKLVVYSPRQRATVSVLVTNIADGWNSLCSLVAKDHGQFQLQVVSARPSVEYPSHRMQIWDGGKSIRKVMVLRDSDKWKFFQSGELQDFEQGELYGNRIIKRRLDRQIILRYLKKIDLDVSDQSFWESDRAAIYFEELSKRARS